MTPKCAYCTGDLPKGKRKFCSDLCTHLFWHRIYNQELARPGHRPRCPGAWEYIRTWAIAFAGHKCERCGTTDDDKIARIRANMKGSPEWMISQVINESTYFEVHHIVPIHMGGDSTLDNLIVLCKECHLEEHRGIRASEKLRKHNQQTLAGVTA